MTSADASFDAAPRLELGNISMPTADDKFDRKAPPDGSPTLTTSSTFMSTRTFGSAISGVKRAQTWVAGAAAAVRPNLSKGKIDVQVPLLESFPMGYPRLACYLDSDDSFMVYRRYGVLHARLLLQKQDILRKLESELFTSDCQDNKTEMGKLCLQSREEESEREEPARGCRPKCDILADIQKHLLEYGHILKQAQELVAMNKPHSRDHRSVVNFVENHQPLVEGERDFIYLAQDLVSLRSGRENAWLDAAVEVVLRWYPCKPIKRVFCTEDDQRKSTDENIHYFSRTRINFVVTLIITLIILALLVAPIVGLFELLQNHNYRTTDAASIGILLVSTLVFSSVLSMFTKAKRHEILAAAAGYCAVLVVFVGNVGSAPGNVN